jgi:hypothetical protein
MAIARSPDWLDNQRQAGRAYLATRGAEECLAIRVARNLKAIDVIDILSG